MIFETHAHYDDEAFDHDRDLLLQNLLSGEICRIINVGASIGSTKASIALAETYENIYAAAGVHPSEIDELNEESFAWLKEQTAHPNVIAVGEVGLDYYWEKDTEVRKKQRDWFARQMELARESGLPVIIHSRDAAEDTLDIMRQAHASQIPGVIHCFSYSPEIAMEYVRMGYYIGVGGVVTFKNAKKLKETVATVPLERILLETDCPYMAPEPYRGKRNSSLYLPYVVSAVAEIKGITEQEVIKTTFRNACEMYRISD